jgi:hypothetical protein
MAGAGRGLREPVPIDVVRIRRRPAEQWPAAGARAIAWRRGKDELHSIQRTHAQVRIHCGRSAAGPAALTRKKKKETSRAAQSRTPCVGSQPEQRPPPPPRLPRPRPSRLVPCACPCPCLLCAAPNGREEGPTRCKQIAPPTSGQQRQEREKGKEREGQGHEGERRRGGN